METFSQLECHYIWTPGRDASRWSDEPPQYAGEVSVAVGRFPAARRPHDLWMPSGNKNFSAAENLCQLFLDFHTLVVRDRIDPQSAHREFLTITEYRDHISPDTGPAAITNSVGHDSEFLWGAGAIASFMGLNRRQAYNLLEQRLIPSKKVGNKWIASKRQLADSLADKPRPLAQQQDDWRRGLHVGDNPLYGYD